MKKEVVLVFQKNAILGKVKTRLAAGMGELLRLGPRPQSASFPPGHPFEHGFVKVFIDSGILASIIVNTRFCCLSIKIY
jgi:hypothetical protein